MKFILPLLLVLSAIPKAHAWSEETHMTTGAIAFDTLQRLNPQILADLEQIIMEHPHYNLMLRKTENLHGRAKLRVMMQWMARWPDDIRGTKYSHPEWHTELRVVYGRTWLWPFRNQSALDGLDINYRILSDKSASKKERAIAASWLLHIIGDIQQPLHAGHQMTAEFPATDEAGLLAYIYKPDGKIINLHQYWDRMLDKSGSVQTTSDYWSPRLQKQWPYGSKTMITYKGDINIQFSNWLDETMLIAKKFAYSGTYLRASADKDKAPIITAKEHRVAFALSKRRVVTGGYRIADTFIAALHP